MPLPSLPAIRTAAAEVAAFVRVLPAYYGTLNPRDPLVLLVAGMHVAFVTGLVLARRSPIVTLSISFVLLLCCMLAPPMHDYLHAHAEELLQSRFVTRPYFEGGGIFVLGTWMFPILAYTLFFALLLVATLVLDIVREVRRIGELRRQAPAGQPCAADD